MDFQKAKKLLMKMAKGDYCTISYSITVYSDSIFGEPVTCSVYINNYGFSQASTWKKSLEGMRKLMSGPKIIPVDITEQPGEEEG